MSRVALCGREEVSDFLSDAFAFEFGYRTGLWYCEEVVTFFDV